jgi:hypothetical protein
MRPIWNHGIPYIYDLLNEAKYNKMIKNYRSKYAVPLAIFQASKKELYANLIRPCLSQPAQGAVALELSPFVTARCFFRQP